MWELVVIVALLAVALAFCAMVMAFQVHRMMRAHEGLIDRIMATDWPSYAGYVKSRWQDMAPYHLRAPEGSDWTQTPPSAMPVGLDLTDEYQQIPDSDQAETVGTFRP